MLKNYIKIALRNLTRQKGYSFINIFGLAIGIACCLLIYLYVIDSMSYDAYHKKSDQIYRIAKKGIVGGNEFSNVRSQVPMGPAIENNFSEVKYAIRFWRAFEPVVEYNNDFFKENKLYFTDPDVFEVFSFKLLKGNPEYILSEPYSVVLSKSKASKYFGDEDPIGKVLSYNGYPAGKVELTVTGVMDDLPTNTQFDFDMLVSLTGVETEADNWGSSKPIWTYVLLNRGVDPKALEEKLPSFLDNQHSSSVVTKKVDLEPLTSMHLYSSYQGGFKPGGNIIYVYLFASIGFFILIIACINFVNLSTARALKRAAEVGVRKTLGAQRSQLVKQFLGEALVITALALLLGLFFVEAALPVLNDLAEKNLYLSLFEGYGFIGSLFLLWITVGFSAGLYPAFFLSGFEPVRIMGTKINKEPSGEALRKGLVVFQFAVSIVLIVSAITIYNQMDYVRNKNLGFDKEQVVVVPYSENEKILLGKLSKNPNIINASVSQRVPVNEINSDGQTVTLPAREEPIRVESYVIDENFLDTYKITLLAGRDFRKDLASDTSSFLINETAVYDFGWSDPQEALGKKLTWSGISGTIIGVVKDFHITSLRERIEPLVMGTMPGLSWWKTFISVRIQQNRIRETLNLLEKNWKEVTPEGAYDYFFIDQSIEQLHKEDQRTGRIFTYFAGLAIFIACMGLFGLASYMANKREKEVGIRKVFGAEIKNIILLLSKGFIWLVGIGFIIAVPIAYLMMDRWLQNFAYHVEIGAGVFINAALISIGIAMISVIYQTTKAALMNPVKSLRSECTHM